MLNISVNSLSSCSESNREKREDLLLSKHEEGKFTEIFQIFVLLHDILSTPPFLSTYSVFCYRVPLSLHSVLTILELLIFTYFPKSINLVIPADPKHIAQPQLSFLTWPTCFSHVTTSPLTTNTTFRSEAQPWVREWHLLMLICLWVSTNVIFCKLSPCPHYFG